MRMAHEKWEIRVSIINTINFLSVHESKNVVFDNWALSHSCCHRSSNVSSNGITESEDILKSLVLKGVWVNINQTIRSSNSSINEILPWLTWWVKVSVSKSRFNDFSTINVFESCNLFISLTVVYFQEFPTEHNFDSSLVAFFKSDLISVTKFKDFFIWSPVLDF